MPAQTVGFDEKAYFANYYGKGLSYFDQPLDLTYSRDALLYTMNNVKPARWFKTFLDLGAANGAAMVETAKHFAFERMDGIELSETAVAKLLPGQNVVHGDVLKVLPNMAKHGLLPKYDVILASLLMYFSEKQLVTLLAAIAGVCDKHTLVMFPLDPDDGKKHGYVKGVYKKFDPNAFVSVYRPLAWWLHLLNNAGFEIVDYSDPTGPVCRYVGVGTVNVGWGGNNDLIGDPTQVIVKYLDGGLDTSVTANSAVQLKASGFTLNAVYIGATEHPFFTDGYWMAMNSGKVLKPSEKLGLTHIRSFIKSGGLGLSPWLMLNATVEYQYLPGFFAVWDGKLKVWHQETDVAI